MIYLKSKGMAVRYTLIFMYLVLFTTLTSCSKRQQIKKDIDKTIERIDGGITEIKKDIVKAKKNPNIETIEIIEADVNNLHYDYLFLKEKIDKYELQCKIDIKDYKHRYYGCLLIVIGLSIFVVKKYVL